MSEVFSIRLDDGPSNQIIKLDNSTEWIKEAIIQKAMNEQLLPSTYSPHPLNLTY